MKHKTVELIVLIKEIFILMFYGLLTCILIEIVYGIYLSLKGAIL